jgi:hypothetical protein
MDDKALFAGFWEDGDDDTRKVIARIPEGSDYRPDPKSRTAGEIAWQIICEETMLIDALESGKAEWAPAAAPATIKEMVDRYDAQRADLVGRLKALPAARWDGTLEFFGSQRPASTMAWELPVRHRAPPRARSRPTCGRWDSTVPQIYGPSGDEP